MAESSVNVTEGTGKRLHTNQRTIGGNPLEDEYVLPGEYSYPAYTVPFNGASLTTAGDDVIAVQAGGTNAVRVRRIFVEQVSSVTTAALAVFQIIRLTAAGTGGTAVTPAKLENADAAAGATAQSGVPNATHGTAGTELFRRAFWLVQTIGTSGAPPGYFEWVQLPNSKPILIPSGAANGLAVRNNLGRAGATVQGYMEIVETPY